LEGIARAPDPTPRSLLIVRLSAIGDVVHGLPALELARAALPHARIGWAVEAEAAPLLRNHPAIDRLHVLDRRALGRERGRGVALGRAVAFGQELREARYDLALDLQGLARSALVARLGARRVLGPAHARELAPLAYDLALDTPAPAEAHAVARSLAIVRAGLERSGVAVPAAAPAPRLVLSKEAHEAARVVAPGAIVLLPGAGKAANRVPVALLARVARTIEETRPGSRFVVAGGPRDRADAAALARETGALDLAGRLTLDASAAVLAKAAAVVGGDTGPLHLARALGRPVVALFFAADPFRTGPAGFPGEAPAAVLRGGAPCAPCLARTCQRADRVRICLDPLDARAIAAAVLDAVSETASVT
jgi:lipopolysaccharide heptosyltransferase I